MGVNLVKNKDGTYSFDSNSFTGWADEDGFYNRQDANDLKDYINHLIKYGEQNDVSVSRHKLKNHKETLSFKIACQTIAVPKKTLQQLIDFDFGSTEKRGDLITKPVVQIKAQAPYPDPYDSNAAPKVKDAKGAFSETITVENTDTTKGEMIVFSYNSYIFACSKDALEAIIQSNEKKYKIVEVK
jgi:hypothetical protein